MTEKEIEEMNIFEKMMHISAEAKPLTRDLMVQQGNRGYASISEKAVLEIIKPLEEKYRVYSCPAERSCTTKTLQREYPGDPPWSESLFVNQVSVTYRFVNVDNPDECVEIMSYGTGIDSYDKAPGKAMTYADKYAIIKAYKLYGEDPRIGEDPDAEGSPEKGIREVSEEETTADLSQSAPERQEVQKQANTPARLEKSAQESQQVQKQAPNQGKRQTADAWMPPGVQRGVQKKVEAATSAPMTQEPEKKPAQTNGEMTLEEAKAFMIPIGRAKGITIGEALVRDRSALEFFGSERFENKKYPDLKKAAKMVLSSL